MLAVRYALICCIVSSFCNGMEDSMQLDSQSLKKCEIFLQLSEKFKSALFEKSLESKLIARIRCECFKIYDDDHEKACLNLTTIAGQQNGFKQLGALYQKHRMGAYPLLTQCARLDMIDLASLLLKNGVYPEENENPWLWVRTDELVHLFNSFRVKGIPDPKTGDTLAHKAAFWGDLEVLQALRTVKRINHAGETPLFGVIDNIQDIPNPIAIAHFLLSQAPAMKNRPRNDGYTPLLYLQYKYHLNSSRTDLSSGPTLAKLASLEWLLCN